MPQALGTGLLSLMCADVIRPGLRLAADDDDA